MKRKKNLYEMLGVAQAATMQEIKQAHEQLTVNLEKKQPIIGDEETQVQKRAIDMAFDVLSVQHSRDAYDAKLAPERPVADVEDQIDVVVAIDDNRKNPLARILTVIAVILAVWIGLQLIFSFMAYRNASEYAKTPQLVHQQQEKLRLQEFYQVYGIKADSLEEAEARLAEQRQESREQRKKESLEKQQDQEYERWLREGDQISERQNRERQRAEKSLYRELTNETSRFESESESKKRRAERQRETEAYKQRRKLGLKPI